MVDIVVTGDDKRPSGGNGTPGAGSRRRMSDSGATRGLLDEVNRSIIDLLQEDGRRTYGSIGEAVGLSEAATRQRVQKLRDAGVIDIIAVTEPDQLGLRCQAVIGIHVDGDVETVAEQLAEVDELSSVMVCAGSFDIFVEAVVKDDRALFDLLNDAVRPLEGVRQTEAFVCLHIAKKNYGWGGR